MSADSPKEPNHTHSHSHNHNHNHNDKYEWLAYVRFIRHVRPLAYSNEVGEAFRHAFPKLLVPSYVLAFGYISADIGLSVAEAKPEERKLVLFDQTLWHSIASLVVPGVTVHQTVKITTKAVKNMTNVHAKRIIPVAVGLGIIPFIVHPIDHLADYVMDNTVRKWY